MSLHASKKSRDPAESAPLSHNHPRPRPPASVGPGADQVRPTVLLVEDDSAVREGLRRVLQCEDWQIVSAASGEEALEYLAAHHPDLMITDLSMAAVSGWDLLFHQKLQRPELPIFVITALPLPAAGGADKFAHEFFQKPLDFDVLVATVRRYLSKASSPAGLKF